jgi:hypothetical protein
MATELAGVLQQNYGTDKRQHQGRFRACAGRYRDFLLASTIRSGLSHYWKIN